MKIHLIGIAGTGMGAFAGLLKKAGFSVQGSDLNTYPPMKDKLAEWNIEVKTPYAASNLEPPPDLVIVGNVASKDNLEAKAVLEKGIPYKSFPQALGDLFLKQAQSIVVSGTHGKTSCSALLAHTLVHAGYDPGFLIGGIPKNFGESFRLAKNPSNFFVVEGDEYDTAFFDKGPKFLHYAPKHILATSLEYDHADIYQSVEQIEDRFVQLFALAKPGGFIVCNAESPRVMACVARSSSAATIISYGQNGLFEASLVQEDELGLRFDIKKQSQSLGQIFLPLNGAHNLSNGLGCYALLTSVGLSHEAIAAGFASFAGVKRRMEIVGEKRGIVVIDDFAHHPTAVLETIKAAKAKFKNRPLWAIFEPRSATSCRRIFQDDFANSFSNADRVLLAPIGRQLDPEQALDTALLASQISEKGSSAKAFHSIEEIISSVAKEVPSPAALLCMSNGSFGGIHQRILDTL